MAYVDPNDKWGYEEAQAAGLQLHKRDKDGDLTQSMQTIIPVVHELGIGITTLEEYMAAAALVKYDVKGKDLGGYPMSCMLLNVANEHCCIALAGDAHKHKFTFPQIARAYEKVSKRTENLNKPVTAPTNSKAVMQAKSKNKQQRK